MRLEERALFGGLRKVQWKWEIMKDIMAHGIKTFEPNYVDSSSFSFSISLEVQAGVLWGRCRIGFGGWGPIAWCWIRSGLWRVILKPLSGAENARDAQYFFGRLRYRGEYGDPYRVNQARPITGGGGYQRRCGTGSSSAMVRQPFRTRQ